MLDDGRILLVQVDQPLARVPQLAIHLDRDVNEQGLALDKQLHLTPVWGLGPPVEELGEFLANAGARPRTGGHRCLGSDAARPHAAERASAAGELIASKAARQPLLGVGRGDGADGGRGRR